MKFRRTAGIAASLVAVVLAAAACGTEDSSGNEGPTDVSIYYTSPLTQYAIAAIAEDHDLFPDDVNVKVEGGDSTVGVTLATSGRVQFYLNTAPMTENIAHGGAPIKWAASWQDGLNGLFIGRNGVEALADMKGKSLGIAQPGLTLSVVANAALAEAGLDSDDYTSVSLGTVPAMAGAFAAGSIDGVVLDRMSASRLLAEVDDAEILYDFSTDMPFVGSGVSVNTDWLAKNEDAAVSVLQGLQAALELFHNDPDAVRKSVTRVTGIQEGEQLDAVIKDFIANSNPTLAAVSEAQLDGAMTSLQLDGNDWATMDFAKTVVINPKFLQKALEK